MYHDGMMFTTYDRDNDPWSNSNAAYKNNCAVYYGGGFWYKDCGHCSVTGSRQRNRFYWYSPQIGSIYLQSTRMWLMC